MPGRLPGDDASIEHGAPADRAEGLAVRLLGECAITYAGEPLTQIDSPRLQSLLSYLLLHRSAPQSRRYLASLLWPESAEDQARTNLRQLLHHLKRELPDADRFVVADAKHVGWNPSAPCLLDVADFDRLLDEGKPADAVPLYRGRLLPSCYDDWIAPERDRLEQRFREALAHLAREASERGDYDAAIRWGKRRVRVVPVDEAAYLDLIRAHLAQGNRAEAMQTFHACASTLSRELGVGPSPATLAAYQTLLRTAGVALARVSTEAQLFVARVAELAKLKVALAEAQAGRPSVAVVMGEAGIGKSRLADELRRWARLQGIASAWTRAYPTSQTLAYAPVTEWLRSDAVRPSIERQERSVVREIGRLLPELVADRQDLHPPLAEGWQRLRLFDALARTVLSSGRAQLLVLDDLQWCDQETLDFLAFLLRFDPAAKLLVVGTVRVEEIPTGHPLGRWLSGLPAVTRVDLGPLDLAETAALASAVGGRKLDPDAAERVYRETEGNPLFVVESVRPGGAATRAQAIIAARLDAADRQVQALLGLAATIGRAFSFELLARASGGSEAELVRGLDEAWSRHLIRDHGEAGYDFAHDRIREEAYERLSTARKRLHHLAIAQALERHDVSDPENAAAQIAFHYDRAGRKDDAIRYYERAALASQRLSANAESVALLERALTLGSDGSDKELALLLALGVPLVALKGYGAPRVLTVYRRAQALAAELKVQSPPVLRGLAIAYLVRGELREAEGVGRRLMAVAGDDPVIRVEADYVLGVAAFWMGQFADAICHLEESVRRVRRDLLCVHREQFSQDPEVVCLVRLALALFFAGRPDRALERSEEALRLARSREHPFSLAYVLHWKAWLHVLREDVAAAAAAEESVAFSLRHEFAYWHTQGRVLRGFVRGDRSEVEEGLAAFRETGTEVGRPYFLTLLARLAETEGRRVEAQAALDAGLAAARARQERWSEAEILRTRAEIKRVAGDRAGARDDLIEAMTVAKSQGAITMQVRVAEDQVALDPAARADAGGLLGVRAQELDPSVKRRARGLTRGATQRKGAKNARRNGG